MVTYTDLCKRFAVPRERLLLRDWQDPREKRDIR